MTDPILEASEIDLADQALPVDDEAVEAEQLSGYSFDSADADIADLLEQRQSVPSGEDDYDRG